jgi:hypothetical protein
LKNHSYDDPPYRKTQHLSSSRCYPTSSIPIMKASVLFAALLPAVLAAPGSNRLPARQEEASPTLLPSAVAPTNATSEVPCPTAPPKCLSKPDGHIICMAGGVWCRYTDVEHHGTPGFFPINYEGPCAPCLPSW